MCGIWDRGMASSFWNQVIQISIRQVHFQDLYSQLWIVKIFSENIYFLKSNIYFRGIVMYLQYGVLYLILTRPKFAVQLGAEILWRPLKSSPFELQLSDSDTENVFRFVRQFSSKRGANRQNPTNIDQTGSNFGFVLWKRCDQAVKGTVSRDFSLLVFFVNQFPPSPRVSQ